MHCIHMTNAVNMLVMCNEEIYCPHVLYIAYSDQYQAF